MRDVIHSNLGRLNSNSQPEALQEILLAALAQWPVYDLAIFDKIDDLELDPIDQADVLFQSLRRLRAFMDLREACDRNPMHLGINPYQDDNLDILARELASAPFKLIEGGFLRMDFEHLTTRLRIHGIRWDE